MWRSDGIAEAYIYAPQQLNDYYQQEGFYTNNAGDNGDSLWRNVFHFDLRKWNTIKIYLKLNSFNDFTPNYDGEIALSINSDDVVFYDKMLWIKQNISSISGLMMQTFFGGNRWTYRS